MSQKLILISFLIVTLSCSKEEFDIQNLNGNKISALGHSGMGNRSAYPRNSYESLTKSLNLGADGIEIDLQLTKDNVLIAFHDEDLSESTNIKGLVRSLTWSEIQNAYYTNPLYTSYSIISMDQLLSNTDDMHQYNYTLDCKYHPLSNDDTQYETDYINALSQLITKFNLINNAYIESQSEDFLRLLQLENNEFNLFINPYSFEYGLETANKLGLFGISMSTDNISEDQIEAAHDNNLFIAIWGVQTNGDNTRAVNKNPDFIQTDCISHLVNLLD